MRKNLVVILLALMFMPVTVFANEGMWFLMFIERLNHRDMEKMGLQLTSEEIYSINNNSLKDAIVQFNGGCTAEIVSNQGLVLTNHHCGYNVIAELSTSEHNYLRDGFWASTRQNELKPKSLYVRFFVRMDDVSKRILSQVNNNMTEAEREAAINKEIEKIQNENSEGGKYTVSVKSFFQGNEYYYFVYEDYSDVRLVGTPPESIGKYGGDTDNWEWPRHTGDFSMFRVYADKNGSPAEYSTDNIPLKPKHYLPVNIKGVHENDYAMILGYPGRTNRWMPAEGINQNVKYAYPAWVEGSKTGMDMMKKHMDKDDTVRLLYASQYARVANYWKNRQGMIVALTQHKTAATKAKNEAKFDKWAHKKKNRKKYGNVIKNINTYYALTNDKSSHDNYMSTLFRTSNMSVVSRTLGRKLFEYAKMDKTKQVTGKSDMENEIKEFYKTLYLPIEKDVLAAQLALYANKANYNLAPAVAKMKADKTNYANYVETLFNTSIFGSEANALAFLDNTNTNMIVNDPMIALSNDLLRHYYTKSEAIEKAEEQYSKSFRLLVEGFRESKLSTILYPDANSTLRLTYGKVNALPADKRNDAKINNYTTMTGMVNKYKPNDTEFDLPKRVLDMFKAKDFGRYADKDGYMPINFLTDNDITGGNSGSPVLNGKGELIGLAFDGNIEAMAGDVIFDPQLQRTINVDIRYVLWLIDKFANAKHIVDEMTIIE
ncbi:MAG: S46 family peptidase [Aestuariibaculum sp.]